MSHGAEYIFKSRGNKQTIVDFINRHSDNEDRVMGILATLSDKDLRDITTEIAKRRWFSLCISSLT